MPRKGEVPKRKVLPDPKYTDAPADLRRRITKFVNVVMRDGEKQIAEGIVYGAMDLVAERAKDDPLKVWDRALANVRPRVEVKSRRVGGSTYQVPVEVKPHRANTLALRWLTSYAKARREKTMTERLTNEILDASNGLGAAVKRREDTHKMAESNKAFAHYRW
jgi:small subunit ribosomal protein S7